MQQSAKVVTADFMPVRTPTGLDMRGLTAHSICESNFDSAKAFHAKVLPVILGPIQKIYGRDDFCDEHLEIVRWVIVLRDADANVVAVACMGTSFGISFHGFWTAFEGVLPSHRRVKVGTLLFRVVEFVAQVMAVQDPTTELNMRGEADLAIRAHVDRGDTAGSKFMRSLGFVQTERKKSEITFVRRVPILGRPPKSADDVESEASTPSAEAEGAGLAFLALNH